VRTSTSIRRLRGVEHALIVEGRASPLNLVVLVGLDGSSLDTVLPAVLARLQARHPLLRTRILGADRRPRFSVEDASRDTRPIPLRTMKVDETEIRGLVEEEMNTGFDEASPPLARALYARGSGSQAWLILTLLHCTCDGVSAGRLVDELLEGCRRELEERPVDDLPDSYDLPSPLTDLLPPEERGVAGAGKRGAFAMRELAEELRYRRPPSAAGRPLPPAGHARTLMLSLTRPETEDLVAWCRDERLTLTSVLNAALLHETVRHLYAGRPVKMRAVVWVDLRPHLTPPPAPHALACYISMLRIVLRVDTSDSVAALGRRLQERTSAGVRRGDRVSAAVLSPGASWAMARTRSMRLGTTALSYGGADPVAATYGTIEVREVRAFVPDNRRGAQLALVAGLRDGAIWCNLLYLDSEVEETTAEIVAAGLRGVLTAGPRA